MLPCWNAIRKRKFVASEALTPNTNSASSPLSMHFLPLKIYRAVKTYGCMYSVEQSTKRGIHQFPSNVSQEIVTHNQHGYDIALDYSERAGENIPVCTFCFHSKPPHALLSLYTHRYITQFAQNARKYTAGKPSLKRNELSRDTTVAAGHRNVLVLDVPNLHSTVLIYIFTYICAASPGIMPQPARTSADSIRTSTCSPLSSDRIRN